MMIRGERERVEPPQHRHELRHRQRHAPGGRRAVGDVEEDRAPEPRRARGVVGDHRAVVVRRHVHRLRVRARRLRAIVDPEVVVGARGIVVPHDPRARDRPVREVHARVRVARRRRTRSRTRPTGCGRRPRAWRRSARSRCARCVPSTGRTRSCHPLAPRCVRGERSVRRAVARRSRPPRPAARSRRRRAGRSTAEWARRWSVAWSRAARSSALVAGAVAGGAVVDGGTRGGRGCRRRRRRGR